MLREVCLSCQKEMALVAVTIQILLLGFLDYLVDLFLSGFSHGDGSKRWSALKDFVPAVLADSVLTTRIGKALKGW